MDSGIRRRPVAATANSLRRSTQTPCGHANLRPNAVAVRPHAFQAERQEPAPIGPILKIGQGRIVVGHTGEGLQNGFGAVAECFAHPEPIVGPAYPDHRNLIAAPLWTELIKKIDSCSEQSNPVKAFEHALVLGTKL